ncbi:MAG TPA: flavin reductase family protein [Candidatus Thermoplasmatota archaeon]|nr:flavin reductase family protein [Candidatus Thermoplasmatota archaeon]
MSADDASAALAQIRTTLLVLGTKGVQGPHFMVANWGTQASFDPWRFVMLVKKSAHTLGYAKAHQAFTVNLLRAGEAGLVKEIMKAHGEGRRAEKGSVDAPRLPEAYAGFDCAVLETIDIGGDHMLVVADVVDGWKNGEGPALLVQDAGLNYAG